MSETQSSGTEPGKIGPRGPRIDHNAVWRAKAAALELLWRPEDAPRPEMSDGLRDFATFCALAQRHGPRWSRWSSSVPSSWPRSETPPAGWPSGWYWRRSAGRGEPRPPGTVNEYPNWRLPLPVTLEQLQRDPRVARVVAALRSAGSATSVGVEP